MTSPLHAGQYARLTLPPHQNRVGKLIRSSGGRAELWLMLVGGQFVWMDPRYLEPVDGPFPDPAGPGG